MIIKTDKNRGVAMKRFFEFFNQKMEKALFAHQQQKRRKLEKNIEQINRDTQRMIEEERKAQLEHQEKLGQSSRNS